MEYLFSQLIETTFAWSVMVGCCSKDREMLVVHDGINDSLSFNIQESLQVRWIQSLSKGLFILMQASNRCDEHMLAPSKVHQHYVKNIWLQWISNTATQSQLHKNELEKWTQNDQICANIQSTWQIKTITKRIKWIVKPLNINNKLIHKHISLGYSQGANISLPH